MVHNGTLKSTSPNLWPSEGKTAHEFLLERAERFSEKGKPYLIDGSTDERRYLENFEDETRRIASHFFKKGLRKGDIVLYLSQKQINLVVMQCGVWRANGIVRSVYFDDNEDTYMNVIKESEAKWVLCDSNMADVLLTVREKIGWPVEIIICEKDKRIPNCTSFEDFLADDGSMLPETEVNEDDLAMILPTSGTTGLSKGAMHSHKSVLAIIQLYANCGFTRAHMNLSTTRATHISGSLSPYCMITQGCTSVVLPTVTPETLIRAVDKYKPGTVFALTSLVLALGSEQAKSYDMSSIKIILTGGAPVTPEIMKVYQSIGNVTDIIVAYGLTEGAIVCTTRNFDAGFQSLVDEPISYYDVADFAVGKVCSGAEIQIRDVQDSSKVLLLPGERGEICFRSDVLFKGYFKNPEKTKEAFVDGWFKTGDVGYFDAQGYVFIVDRCKDIFKYLGNHVSPTEIENVIAQHPSVSEVGVVPVPVELGEVPRAFVTLKTSQTKININGLTEEITLFANERLASYKHIRGGVVILNEMPRGKTGKVTRNLLIGK